MALDRIEFASSKHSLKEKVALHSMRRSIPKVQIVRSFYNYIVSEEQLVYW